MTSVVCLICRFSKTVYVIGACHHQLDAGGARQVRPCYHVMRCIVAEAQQGDWINGTEDEELGVALGVGIWKLGVCRENIGGDRYLV